MRRLSGEAALAWERLRRLATDCSTANGACDAWELLALPLSVEEVEAPLAGLWE